MRRLVSGIVTAVLLAAPVSAQTLRQIAGAIEQNQRLLKSYVWESRIEIDVDGVNEKVELYTVRYTLEGELQKTLVSEEITSPAKGGPIRKKMSKSKLKKARERRAELKQLIDAYIHPDDETVKKMASHAKVTAGTGNYRGQTRVQIRDVERTGDIMNVYVDGETFVETHYEIMTAILGDPVNVVAEFGTLDGGVNYPASTVIDTEYDGKKVKLTVENYNYVPQD